MNSVPLLSLMIAIPLVGGMACLFVSATSARWVALLATLLDLILGILMWTAYVPGGPQWQFVEHVSLAGNSLSWALGIDGIALMLIMLSVFLMPICIGASWRSIEKRVPEYMAAFLLMEALMIGVFAAQDLLLFYIFFEGGLIPMYLIIGIWGGAE
uniref:proton-conducting transporter transmembrane domain-containing protein n=1 Tax=Sphingomonas sp. TaxID=28214 RepID=UPI0025EA5214